LHGLTSSGGDGGADGDASVASDGSTAVTADATTSVDSGGGTDAGKPTDSGTTADSGNVVVDSGADASCTCSGLVSAYRFADPNNLGHDVAGNNNMTDVKGGPLQSTVTPTGLTGHSVELDGGNTLCIDTGFTFDSTSDHTLCWWSQPAALANGTNQFAQYCGYDTWTATSGADYLWRINNCNTGTPADLQVPGVYQVGQWTQICQTYSRATMTRTVIVNGQTTQKVSIADTVPIAEVPTSQWCIGSYGGGGYWTGLIYSPMWFDRVLTDEEIKRVNATACCLP
jgi:hypothetical protein